MSFTNVATEIFPHNFFAAPFPTASDPGSFIHSLDTMGDLEVFRDVSAGDTRTTNFRGALIGPLTRRHRSARVGILCCRW